jgi:L-ascorbate metabolism protein UlaG (beta-lactamase superfamily)
MLSITWLGHSTFLVVFPNRKRVVFDTWLGNPNCPPTFAKPEALKPLDLILLSHGHSDHSGDVIPLARATEAPVVCLFELGEYLTDKGLKNVRDMGIGGTQTVGDFTITMTNAVHSGSIYDGERAIRAGVPIVYLGGAAGFVVKSPGAPTIYFAGDTALFGDMKIIGEIYKPEIAFLPIGDHYTMGPDTAAIAAEWLGVKQVVPMHWGTFPLLRGTPSKLKEHLSGKGIDVLELKPGDTAK